MNSFPVSERPWQTWKDGERERIDIVVDSGASTSALPREVAKDYPLKPRTSTRIYTTACKKDVTMDGEKTLTCGFMNGEDMETHWEVGDIHRPLSSVSRMVKNGHCVWFDTEENGGSYIYNHGTGETMKIYEREGIYVLSAWIKDARSEGGSPGFTRQGSP